MTDRSWAAIGAVAAIAVAGCATLRSAISFTEPDVALERIEITGLGMTGGTFDLVLDVYNPNAFEIRGTRLELGLDLEGTHFGDALLERPLALSREAHSRVVVPVRFEWAGVGAGARSLVTRQAVRYALSGSVIVVTPLGDKRVGLRGTGDVPLKKLLP